MKKFAKPSKRRERGAAPVPRKMSSRELAMHVVRDVFGPEQRNAQAAFDVRARRTDLDARDRKFAAELAYGTIKMRRLLDWYLAPYLAGRPAKLPEAIADVLRMGVYQLLLMDGVENHAAVFETVNLALRFGHRGTAGLVNAILRRVASEPPAPPQPAAFESELDYLATRASLPTWVVTKWHAVFGERVEAIVAGVDLAPQHAISINTLAAGFDVADTFPLGVPSPYVANVVILEAGEALSDDPAGRWVVQNEAAAVAADLLAVRPGQDVIEIASGRGNKTVQLAGAMENSGTLTCVEIDARKIRAWRATLERCGITCATIVEGDALVAELPQADAVLVDAPCSGLGTLGRHPEARWRKSPSDGERLAVAQRALLERAANLVRPGGRLVYSVCSNDVREGPEIVESFISEHSDFVRSPLPERYAEFAAATGDLVIAPGIAGRDGFYIASFHRN